MKIFKYQLILLLAALLIQINCSDKPAVDDQESTQTSTSNGDPNDWTTNKGIGPISSVTLDQVIDEGLVEEGKSIFTMKCSACHKANKKYIGPPMADILDRRTPEWTMNMILNPAGMVQDDPIAKALLMEYNGTPMANQNLSEDEARAVLEYFRTLKSE